MLAAEPKFRDDLVVSKQDARGQASFVIKDPETGRFFRFGEAEHFIARQLDGKTSLTEVQARVTERFGATNRLESLEGFTERLRKAGLLEPQHPQNERRTTAPKRVRGSILYLRLKAFDPDHLLGQLARQLSFFFSRGFVLASAATILFALGVLIANWEEIQLDLYRLYTTQALFLAWLTALFVTALHEFAHGLTCKHFGRSVREMGFLLIYFQPAFYCNVSDAWLIPKKSKRMWVSFAGAYFELFLWAVATLAWRITDPSTLVHNAVLIVMATSAIKSFFNLNPLIKLDGYYALSDYLEIPNLRQKSFDYLRALMQKPRGRFQSADTPPRRERRIYLTYGLLAGGFSFALLSIVAVRVASSLTRQYQAWGFALFVALLVAALQHPLQRLRSKFFPGVQVRKSMSKRTRILAAFGLAPAILFLGRMDLRVSGESAILPAYQADIRAEVDGFIEDVFVDEGAAVRQNEHIVRLSQRDLTPELQQVEAEIDQKRMSLKMLQLGPRPEEIALARQQLETTKNIYGNAMEKYQEAQRMRAERLLRAESIREKAVQRLKYANAAWDRSKALSDAGLISRQENDQAEEQRAVRQKELEEAQAEHHMILGDDLAEFRETLAAADKQVQEAAGKLQMLLLGSRPEEIESGKAEIVRLETQRNYLQEQLRDTTVISPIAGVIVTRKLNEKRGQFVRKGDLVAQVAETTTVRAEASIPEKEVADVKVGQPVVVKVEAYPEKSFHGTVAAIAPAVSDKGTSPGRTVTVTTVLHNEAQLLKPDMTGMAKIYCGKRPLIHLLTRRLARFVRVEFWSWW